MDMTDHKYRILDRHLQLDAFFGLDSDETFLECMVSLDRDTEASSLGFYSGAIDVVRRKVDALIENGELKEVCSGKRVMFIRSVDSSKTGTSAIDEAEGCVQIFNRLRSALNCQVYFLLATSQSIRPLFPDGMYYAHANVKPGDPHNMFKRIVMSYIGYLIQNQTLGSGLIPPKSNRYSASPVEFLDDQAIDIPVGKEVACKVWRKNVPFELFCNIKRDSNVLVVIGQSALDQAKVTLPSFRRWSWSREMRYSCVVLNDPTLYLDEKLDGGWFVGDENHHYLKTAAEIVSDIAVQFGVLPNQVVFMGASAGGFTSLMMASYLQGANAFVDIPQTDLNNYIHKNVVLRLHQSLLMSSDTEKTSKIYKDRLNVVEFFRKNGHVPNIYYLQNSNDLTAGHIKTQFGKFFCDLIALMEEVPQARKAKIMIETYDRQHLIRGGFPLPKKLILQHLDRAVEMFCS